MIDWYLKHRYSVLFATLLASLALMPLRDALGLNARVLELLVSLNLAMAALGLTGHPAWRHGLLAALVAATVTRFLPVAPTLAAASDLLWVLIAALAAAAAVRYALGQRSVDREHISAALSAYLLAGFMFAALYLVMDTQWPGSFRDTGGPDGATGLTLDGAIYFSYVTLATLGYGDVVPVTPAARGVAVVEALAAQIYLVVTVARLVGLYARDRLSEGT